MTDLAHMADIDPISDTIDWSAKAAAADALSRVEHTDPFVALWLGDDEATRRPMWSKANMTFPDLCVLCALLEAMRDEWAGNILSSTSH